MCKDWLRKLKLGIEGEKKSMKEDKEEGWNGLKERKWVEIKKNKR